MSDEDKKSLDKRIKEAELDRIKPKLQSTSRKSQVRLRALLQALIAVMVVIPLFLVLL